MELTEVYEQMGDRTGAPASGNIVQMTDAVVEF